MQVVASSSSTPTHFDKRRFWNAEEADICASLLNKGMTKERGVHTTLDDHEFFILARQHHWEDFIRQPADAVKSLVREFYANLKVRHDNFRVRVRGHMVSFDSATINALFEKPDHDTDGYRAFMSTDPVDYEAVIRFLCKPGVTWKLNADGRVVHFDSKLLKYEAYWWFQFISARIIPTSHLSEVTKERAALVYCIMKKKTIDLGLIIQNSILNAVYGSTTLSMPHSSLITDLCQHAGVTWDESAEKLLASKGPIDIEGASRLKKRGEASGSGQAPHPLSLLNINRDSIGRPDAL